MVENHIHRPHLIAKLNHRLQRPLTLVSAPAGYGKTMLVSNWLEAGSRPGAWVSLDKDDNDWRLFLSYFLTAIQSCHGTEFADVGRKTLAMINAITLPPASVLAANLINELDRIEQPFTLVLDDFHHIEDESVFLLLDQLLHHPPQAMHLVLISRRDPLLAISKMRAKSLLTEIRIQDLRFNKLD